MKLNKTRTLAGSMAAAVFLAALALVLLVAGCELNAPTDVRQVAPVAAEDTSLTRHDYLALLKTQVNHKVSQDELRKIVSGALETTPAGRSVAPNGGAITGVKKLSIKSSGRFLAFTGQGRSAQAELETEPVEIYEFTIGEPAGENTSFVLASNDDRIGNVLVIAEGSLEDANEEFLTVLNANLQDYIDATIIEYNSISEAEIEAALEKAIAEELEGARTFSSHWSGVNLNGWSVYSYSSDFTMQKPPLLVTKWGQGTTGAYSSYGYAYNNYVKYYRGNNAYITGCGPTAMAQIIAYHNYIKPDAPGKPSAFNSASIGQWGGTYNLTAIRNMEYITNTSPPAVKGQVAVLMHQLGVNSLADYYPNLTYNRTMDYIRDGFARMGYTVTNYGKATGLSETANSSTITYYTSPAVIKDALNNNRPVFTRGGLADNSGHFWVIDGYGSMTTYREYFYNTSTGKYGYVTITLTNCLMVHCNLGWDGNANGWYVYGIFDTDNRTLLESGAGTGAGNYSTNTYVLIPKKP